MKNGHYAKNLRNKETISVIIAVLIGGLGVFLEKQGFDSTYVFLLKLLSLFSVGAGLVFHFLAGERKKSEIVLYSSVFVGVLAYLITIEFIK